MTHLHIGVPITNFVSTLRVTTRLKKMNIENLILVALKTMRSKVHACTVVELRFMTERKTNFIPLDLFPSESPSNNIAMCMLELSRYNSLLTLFLSLTYRGNLLFFVLRTSSQQVLFKSL